MAASVPLMERPVMVMGFAVPTFLLANVPAIEPVESVTTSFVSTPDNAAFVVSRTEVADSLALYTRLLAVIPVTVSVFSVIEPVVVGCTKV